MRRSRKFWQRGVQLWRFFALFFFFVLFFEGREYPNTPINWPLLAYLACWWWPDNECRLGSFVIFRGSRTVLQRNPIVLWFFQGAIRTPCPHPLGIRPLILLSESSRTGEIFTRGFRTVFLSHHRISQRAIQTSLENQLDLVKTYSQLGLFSGRWFQTPCTPLWIRPWFQRMIQICFSGKGW